MTQRHPKTDRQKRSRRIVIKIGSSTLTTSGGKVDHDYLDYVADQVSSLIKDGWQPLIVTSAAIACGLEALGIDKRPDDMPSLQAAASVGQSVLSSAYAQAFARHSMLTALILLTRRDTADRNAYLHARDTCFRLLDLGVVPIINENDTISVEHIRFGDNDTLAALVACLVDADLVVMLSDIDGLYDANPQKSDQAHLIEQVHRIDPSLMAVAGAAGSMAGSGGMITKIKAARVLMAAGIPMVICNGRRVGAIVDAASGNRIGTRFAIHSKPHEITPKKLWIALGDSTHGAVVIDEGARNALVDRGSSLLVVGIRATQGHFEAGDIIDIKDPDGIVVARGKVSASSDEVELALGLPRKNLERNRLLANLVDRPIVHRDDLILFE